MEAFIFVIFIIGIFALVSRQNDSGSDQPRRRQSRPRYERPKRAPPRYKTPKRAPANVGPNASWKAPETPARVLNGPVYVIDGDSLRIQKTEIRIFGVDAPEMNHPYGRPAKYAMMALCKGQHVRAEILATDAHGRTVAKCFLPDGRDLSAELVKQGLALDWPKYSGGLYKAFETPDARRKLWLADARQKGRMHVWEKYEADKEARRARN